MIIIFGGNFIMRIKKYFILFLLGVFLFNLFGEKSFTYAYEQSNDQYKIFQGKDRFETNRMIIKEFYGESKEFYITKAYNLVDALTGSVLAKDTPILLVHNGSNKSVLNDATIKITALGGIDKSILEECLNVTNFVGDEDTGVIEKENNGSNEGNNSGDYDLSESDNGTGSGDTGVIWEELETEGDWDNIVGM